MRLLTHNFLQSTVKGTTKGYPLRIRPTEVVVEPQPEVDLELVKRLLPKIDMATLRSAVDDLRAAATTAVVPDLPVLPVVEDDTNHEMLLAHLDVLHHWLMNVHVRNGTLVCPESNREFPIRDGIPNMILHEDEI